MRKMNGKDLLKNAFRITSFSVTQRYS